MNIKLLIFDFDGVLVDSESVFLHVLHDEIVSAGINLTIDQTGKIFTGHDTYTMLQELAKKYNCTKTADEMFKNLLDKKPIWMNSVIAMPNAKELLKKLNVPYCIASNSDSAHINMALEATGLKEFFNPNIIFSAPELGNPKPAPDVYLHALKAMGVKAEDALVIEDSVPGLTAAHAANIPVIGFLSHAHLDLDEHATKLKHCGAFHTIRNLSEVIKLLNLDK